MERSNLPYDERHPLILPGKHHVTSLIAEHFAEMVKHQGRYFTHGAIRGKGFWTVGGKRIISRAIHHCLKCKKLRGQFHLKKMADLHIDRPTPQTRGGQAHNKRWAVIFTCLSTRAMTRVDRVYGHFKLYKRSSTIRGH